MKPAIAAAMGVWPPQPKAWQAAGKQSVDVVYNALPCWLPAACAQAHVQASTYTQARTIPSTRDCMGILCVGCFQLLPTIACSVDFIIGPILLLVQRHKFLRDTACNVFHCAGLIRLGPAFT